MTKSVKPTVRDCSLDLRPHGVWKVCVGITAGTHATVLADSDGLIERDMENAWLASQGESGTLDDMIGHSITYRVAGHKSAAR
jgi:hypothetical protein